MNQTFLTFIDPWIPEEDDFTLWKVEEEKKINNISNVLRMIAKEKKKLYKLNKKD